MFGVFVNAISIMVGSLIGFVLKKGLPDRVTKSVMNTMGLITIFISLSAIIKGEKYLAIIISLVLGTIIGEFIDIDKRINNLGELLKERFTIKGGDSRFAEAFASASILFAVGAMAILGSIDAGLKHDYSILYVKSTLDFVSSIMLTATMGIGVLFSGFVIIIYQGAIALLAGSIKFIADDVSLMNELSCVGNIMIFALGLNLLGATKIKIANMLPALLILPIIINLF